VLRVCYATNPASHRSEHSGTSGRIWVCHVNEYKYSKIIQYLDSNLNRLRLSDRPLVHVFSNIADRHGRWGAHRVATRTTAGGGSDKRGVPTPRHPLRRLTQLHLRSASDAGWPSSPVPS